MKNVKIKIDLEQSETLSKIIKSVELLAEQKKLLKEFRYGNGMDYIIPSKYRNKYGMTLTSLTSCLLESYHQLRLKDDD